jgi:GT2 family glycosyltransferase
VYGISELINTVNCKKAVVKEEGNSVCIILVNYNGWQDTIECLESLLKLNSENFKIIIVDNASVDNSIDYIQKWAYGDLDYNFKSSLISQMLAFPPSIKPIGLTVLNESEISEINKNSIEKITIIKSTKNRGFAGGNNLGTTFSLLMMKPSFIWYINNDTVVDKESLSELIKVFRNEDQCGKTIGIVGSKLMYYHKPNIIQAIGASYKPWSGAVKHIGNNEIDLGQYDNISNKSIDYVVGASILVSREFIANVGPMCNEFFLYFEELDWVKRGKMIGYSFSFAPKSLIYHKEGSSTGGDSRKKVISFISDYYNKRNIIKITRKYYPLFLPSIYASLIIVVFNRIRKKQFERVPSFLKLFITTKADIKNDMSY